MASWILPFGGLRIRRYGEDEVESTILQGFRELCRSLARLFVTIISTLDPSS